MAVGVIALGAVVLVPRLGVVASAVLFVVCPLAVVAMGRTMAGPQAGEGDESDEQFAEVEAHLRRLFRDVPGGDGQ